MNHGNYVLIKKCSKLNNKLYISIRTFITLPDNSPKNNNNVNYAKSMKIFI